MQVKEKSSCRTILGAATLFQLQQAKIISELDFYMCTVQSFKSNLTTKVVEAAEVIS